MHKIQDRAGFRAGDTNLYRYVRNTPITAVDPMGLDLIYAVVPPGHIEKCAEELIDCYISCEWLPDAERDICRQTCEYLYFRCIDDPGWFDEPDPIIVPNPGKWLPKGFPIQLPIQVPIEAPAPWMDPTRPFFNPPEPIHLPLPSPEPQPAPQVPPRLPPIRVVPCPGGRIIFVIGHLACVW